MTDAEGQAWVDALEHYEYRVNLADYEQGWLGNDWTELVLIPGNREQTINLENRFRARGSNSLKSWYAVVFWKMYSNGLARTQRTRSVIERVTNQRLEAGRIWDACSNSTKEGTAEAFQILLTMLSVGRRLPVVATFPAFMEPDRFPMVDLHVGLWVNRYLEQYAGGARGLDSELVQCRDPRKITIDYWQFYSVWINWCRTAAAVLSRPD